MALTSIIQIIKTNEKRSGVKDGRPWEMQDAECILLDDSGAATQVGVLPLPKHLMGELAPLPGVYAGSFALQAGMRDRRIQAVLTDLRPVQLPAQRKPAAPAPAAGS